jgi:hypothetical protein
LKDLQGAKRFGSSTKLFIAIGLIVISISSVVSAPLFSSVILASSGTISRTLPLHTEGKYIRDSQNNSILLRGVWTGMFADSSTGWFSTVATTWNEGDIRYTFQQLRDVWGVNCINFFFWGDWWLENKATTLTGYMTPIGCRDAIIRVVEIAQEYGIYVQPRLYSPTRTEGRLEGVPFAPTYAWSQQDFANFWGNVASYLKDYPNVIYHLFDEPTATNGATLDSWFAGCEMAIDAIRATGSTQLIAIHWGFCGGMSFVENWCLDSHTTENIIFSEHIYRSLGSFGYNNNYPVDIDSIRTFLTQNYTSSSYTTTGTRYFQDIYNVPIWVSAVGTAYGTTNDDEYVAFKNTLQVLNELGVGYIVYSAHRTEPAGLILVDGINQVFSAPNRVGQALIDAIKGIEPPSTYSLSLATNIDPLIYNIAGTSYTTPTVSTKFQGLYTITMPNDRTIYAHSILLGSVAGEGNVGSGYYTYLYTSGPFSLNASSIASEVNLYVATAGKAKVAIYNYADGKPSDLLVSSSEMPCTVGWNTFEISSTDLAVGTYCLAVKIDTNGMLAFSTAYLHGAYKSDNYANAFPTSFGTVEGATGNDFAIYIPTASIIEERWIFSNWEDGNTNPTRVVNLFTNSTLYATYVPSV